MNYEKFGNSNIIRMVLMLIGESQHSQELRVILNRI